MKEQFYSAIKKDSVYYNASLPFFDSPPGKPHFYSGPYERARLGFWVKKDKGNDIPRHIMIALDGYKSVLDKIQSAFDDKGVIREGATLEANVGYSLTKLDRLKSIFTEVKPNLKSISVFITDGATKYTFKFNGEFDGNNPICSTILT